MTAFREADAMKPFIAKARKARALVLDLRGNPGGSIDGLVALVGMLMDHAVTVISRVDRKGEQREVAKPKGAPFAGPLVVLIDSRSASASECLARVVQIEKRGTVIGDRSGGKVMGSRSFTHTFGVGNITVYGTSVTVWDIRMSDGNRLEGIGVKPDELVLPTQADLAARRDPVLARAIALAGGSVSADQAGTLLPAR
jgi:carboxyl-terminal processing protease